MPSSASATTAQQGQLRTFDIPRPAEEIGHDPAKADGSTPAARPPKTFESLRTLVGMGYVQGADWGSEILAGGSFAGAQVQANTLLTQGRQGLRVDNGSLAVFDPDGSWRIDAGDTFSLLRGAGLGARFSWRAAGDRHPAIAVYGPGKGFAADRHTVVAYRDQFRFRGQTLIDAEITSDRSYLLRNQISTGPLEFETLYRSSRRLESDASVTAGLAIWRGLFVSGGLFRSLGDSARNDWNTIAVRFPVGRLLDLTVERAFAGADESSQTTTAAMATLSAGNLRLFHRYQHGEYELGTAGFTRTVERQQTQSMSSYSMGKRVSMTLQLATQRSDSGHVRHWEELHTTFKLTSSTTLRTVTAVPEVGDRERRQVYLRQQLPAGFAVQADYGRLSAYQAVARPLDHPRFKVMVFKAFNIATPAGGAEVGGHVLDQLGRGVPGARVKLGPYTTDSDAEGRYVFRHVPRGEYGLSLDGDLLPADFAWDGHLEHVVIGTGRVQQNLHVTPLNAIHGRVFVDRNGNARVDVGEGLAGVVLQLGDRVTATDAFGVYAFYNVWPDSYAVRVHALPSEYQVIGSAERIVTLLDGKPAIGVDFQVAPKVKPIIWESTSR